MTQLHDFVCMLQYKIYLDNLLCCHFEIRKKKTALLQYFGLCDINVHYCCLEAYWYLFCILFLASYWLFFCQQERSFVPLLLLTCLKQYWKIFRIYRTKMTHSVITFWGFFEQGCFVSYRSVLKLHFPDHVFTDSVVRNSSQINARAIFSNVHVCLKVTQRTNTGLIENTKLALFRVMQETESLILAQ